MRVSNNFMHQLTLLFLLIVIRTSLSVDTNISEHLRRLRNVLQNPVNNSQHWQNPASVSRHISASSSLFYHKSKPVDERISNIVAENVLHFGHNLGLELAVLDPHAKQSELFSPLSIMAALSLLALGAKGRSYQELKQLLGLDSDNELIYDPSKYHEEFGLMLNDLENSNVNNGGVNKRPNANWRFTKLKTAPVRSSSHIQPAAEHMIRVANGLFVQSGYTIKPDYSQVVQSIYKSELTQLDFYNHNREARDYINFWVNRATFGKIPEIINGNIEQTTNIIMASALYFKAFWETSFFPRATTEDYFYPDGPHSPPIKVQMMPTGGVFPFYNAKEYDCRIIGLPYKGNETTMYVIQPNNSTRQKLRMLQQVLNARKINEMIDNMERKTTVIVFPKMHFTRSLTMKNILQRMGIYDIFINGVSDFSLIGGKPLESYASASGPAPSNKVAVPFESISRKAPIYQIPQLINKYNGSAFMFSSRFGETESINNTNTKTDNDTMPIMEISLKADKPKNLDETKPSNNRKKRQVSILNRDPVQAALFNLESNRIKVDSYRTNLFVDDIIHKVDFSLDEQGTEAAAATLTYLHRSGTDVVFRGDTPFLIIIRHDPTKLPLFYGIINKPVL